MFATHTLVHGYGSVIIDWFISPTMKRNFTRLSRNGYSERMLWSLMAANLVATNCLVTAVTSYFSCFETKPRLDALLVVVVVTNLALAELTFTVAHFWLHRTELGAQIHHMHHLCQPCSWSTNLLFHPVDMAVEFSGPIVSLVLSHVLVFEDPFALLISISLLHLWYALDHSENLQLYHYQHHKYIDSTYTIYLNLRLRGGLDTVKRLAMRQDVSHAQARGNIYRKPG